MTDMIKLLSNNIANCLKTREKQYKEFKKYYRYLLETIPKEVCEEVELIEGVATNHSDKDTTYDISLELNDYKWWCLELKKKDVVLIRLKKIKQKVEEALLKAYENMDYEEDYKDIKKALDEFDAEIEKD